VGLPARGRLLVAAVTLAWAALATAQPGDPVQFQEQPPPFLRMPALADDPGDECAQMSRELEALKGHPQRRFALSQRYQAECQGRSDPPLVPGGYPGEP
jgi:hypothetical protein